MTAECLEECDDLILWFSEGQYVYKAMELKMQYKPLTPSQQEKYDRRYEKLPEETAEIPDIVAYAESKSGDAEEEDDIIDAEEIEEAEDIGDEEISPDGAETIPEEGIRQDDADSSEDAADAEPKKKKIGDTMPLGEALKKLLHPEKEILPEEEEEPVLDDLAEEIGEIESVADIDIIAQIAEEKKKAVTAAGEMTEIIPEEIDLGETEEITLEDAEEFFPEEEEETEAEAADAETDIIDEEAEVIDDGVKITDDDQITGQMSLEDILSGWEGAPEKEDLEDEIVGEEAEDLEDGIIEEEAEAPADEIIEEEAEAPADEIIEEEAEDLEAEDVSGEGPEIRTDEEQEQAVADTNTDSLEGEVTGDNMETKKTTEPILPPDIQRLIDEIEGVIPPEEEKPAKPAKRTLERKKKNRMKIWGKLQSLSV